MKAGMQLVAWFSIQQLLSSPTSLNQPNPLAQREWQKDPLLVDFHDAFVGLVKESASPQGVGTSMLFASFWQQQQLELMKERSKSHHNTGCI